MNLNYALADDAVAARPLAGDDQQILLELVRRNGLSSLCAALNVLQLQQQSCRLLHSLLCSLTSLKRVH